MNEEEMKAAKDAADIDRIWHGMSPVRFSEITLSEKALTKEEEKEWHRCPHHDNRFLHIKDNAFKRECKCPEWEHARNGS